MRDRVDDNGAEERGFELLSFLELFGPAGSPFPARETGWPPSEAQADNSGCSGSLFAPATLLQNPAGQVGGFLSQADEQPGAELGRITGADFERAVALLVTIGAGEDEVVIGGASYFVSGSVAAAGRGAELAFTVEEDFQSRGIGSLLMRHIIAIARVKGLDRLEADVLSRNRPMLNVFRRCGLPMAVRHEGDVIHVILSLRAAG